VDIPKEDYLDFSINWTEQAYRVLKKDCSGFVISGWQNLESVMFAVRQAGFEINHHCIWNYAFGTHVKGNFVTSHYHVLYVSKGKKVWYQADNYPEDVIKINRKFTEKGKKTTPTQLPAELVRYLLGFITEEGDTVLDPFSGGATVGVGCKQMNRNFIGFEITPAYVDYGNDRIKDTQILKDEGAIDW
jgi:DNA modification methylase